MPPALQRSGQHNWIHGLPLKMRFRRSKLYVSVIPVLALGAGIGFLAAIMGVGGGFIMVPALIYLLRVPTNVVVGTSLFQLDHRGAHHGPARDGQPVRRHRAGLLLMVGGVVGAQFGARSARRCAASSLRALLALLVLAVALRVLLRPVPDARASPIR